MKKTIYDIEQMRLTKEKDKCIKALAKSSASSVNAMDDLVSSVQQYTWHTIMLTLATTFKSFIEDKKEITPRDLVQLLEGLKDVGEKACAKGVIQ